MAHAFYGTDPTDGPNSVRRLGELPQQGKLLWTKNIECVRRWYDDLGKLDASLIIP